MKLITLENSLPYSRLCSTILNIVVNANELVCGYNSKVCAVGCWFGFPTIILFLLYGKETNKVFIVLPTKSHFHPVTRTGKYDQAYLLSYFQ